MSRFPMQRYPDGWFQVAYSSELEPGGVMPLFYFGHALVLYRTDAGEPKLLDAHCPHLGAHLGYGGKVNGDCITCPFHAWRFDGAGACVQVPYAKKIPPNARLRGWPLAEKNGMIMEFHDKATREEAERVVVQMLEEALRVRGQRIRDFRVFAVEHRVERTGCALAAVTLLADDDIV